MPLYEYKCEICGVIFPEMRSVEDRNITTACLDVDCFGQTKRFISRPDIHFKGSGWHKTDYQ